MGREVIELKGVCSTLRLLDICRSVIRMLAQLFFCLAVIDLSLGHPQVSIVYPLIGKQVQGRSPRLDDEIEERDGRIDTKCEGILRPEDPNCCFMTDPNHERTINWTQPLETSPYKINLVAVEQRTLNK